MKRFVVSYVTEFVKLELQCVRSVDALCALNDVLQTDFDSIDEAMQYMQNVGWTVKFMEV